MCAPKGEKERKENVYIHSLSFIACIVIASSFEYDTTY